MLFPSVRLYQVHQLEKALNKLSPIEKQYLADFFKYTIVVSSFGYVIWGDKPMSFETYDPTLPPRAVEGFDYMDDQHILDKYRFREGFETWKKIENEFSLKKYSLFSVVNSNGLIEIYLINHSSFLRTVSEHIEDFRNILQNLNLTPEHVLEGYLSGKYRNQINSHDGLLGTLLGFGKKNAWAYMNEPIDSMEYFGSDWKTVEPLSILLPMFRSLDSGETKQLAENYLSQKKKIEEIYQNGDYLETTILKLTE